MKYFLTDEFAEYIYKSYSLAKGSFSIFRVEAVGPGQEMYVFWYAPDLQENSPEPITTSGWYISYDSDFAESEDKLVKTITEWYGSEPRKVVGYLKEEATLYGVLASVQVPAGYREDVR
jgi:hypothetical protein